MCGVLTRHHLCTTEAASCTLRARGGGAPTSASLPLSLSLDVAEVVFPRRALWGRRVGALLRGCSRCRAGGNGDPVRTASPAPAPPVRPPGPAHSRVAPSRSQENWRCRCALGVPAKQVSVGLLQGEPFCVEGPAGSGFSDEASLLGLRTLALQECTYWNSCTAVFSRSLPSPWCPLSLLTSLILFIWGVGLIPIITSFLF